jgi:hypothetical protein
MRFWTQDLEKQLGDRVNTVLTDPQLLSVFQQFGGAVFRRSSVFHGLDKVLRQWDVRGKLCFEIGTWNGLTSVILSRYFDEVVTIDIAHNALKHEILKHLGITNVRCIDIADNDEKAAVAQDLDFDFAYLDGDHAHDTHEDWALVRDCGRVLFHESWPWQKPVWDLVHSLPMEQIRLGGSGLALWDGSAPLAPQLAPEDLVTTVTKP